MPDADRPPTRPRSRWRSLLGLGTAAAPADESPAAPRPSAPAAERPAPTAAPGPAPAAVDPGPAPVPLAAVLDAWAAELATTGGRGVLLDDRTAAGELVEPLDLGGAHPSGLAAFWAGRPTRLSSLFRERGAHAVARTRVRALRTAAQEVDDAHGVRPCALAVGLVRWAAPALAGDGSAGTGAVDVHAPALLQLLAVHPRGAAALDEELDLDPVVVVNPEVLRLLRERGHEVDEQAVLAPFADGRGDAHRRALGELRARTADVPGLELAERTLVGVYPDLAGALVRDVAALGRRRPVPPVVAALAAAAADGPVDLPSGPAGPVPAAAPWDDAGRRWVLPLDEDQRSAHDALAAGRSLRLVAPPGAGATQLVAQVVASALGARRRVLLVAPALPEVEDVVRRLHGTGLAPVVAGALGAAAAGRSPSARTGEHAVVGVVPAAPDGDEDARGAGADGAAAVASATARLRAGARALDVPAGDGLDVGVLRLLHELAHLAALPRPPRTAVRLPEPAVRAVAAEGLDAVVARVVDAARLGALRPELADGPWEGAAVRSSGEVVAARDRAARLADELLPRLAAETARLGEQTGLRAPRTVEEVEKRLQLLVDVRGTLECFLPGVYQRPLGELVRSLGQDATWRARRTAGKVVAELVRPGARPADLRADLRRADAERRAWAAAAEDGGRPRTPRGIGGAQRALAEVRAELALLEPVVVPTRGGSLRGADLDALSDRLTALATDEDARGDLPARVDVLVHLGRLGLGALVADLRARALDGGAAADEVRLSARASALELARSRGVLDDVLPGRADDARALLVAGTADARARAAAGLVAALATPSEDAPPPDVRGASALALPGRAGALDGPDGAVDLVVLLDAHAVGLPEAALALARGTQVLVVGDPAGPPPAEGVVGSPAGEHPGAGARAGAWSALAGALDERALGGRHRLPRQLLPVLAAVRAEQGDDAGTDRAGDASTPAVPPRGVPTPPGARPVELRSVDGRGRAGDDGVVHSVDAEVAAVVDVVLAALLEDPSRSLGVVAVTREHARRTADALRRAVADDPAVARALAAAPRTEPLVVTDVGRAQGCVRDVLVLSTAFAPTERGRVLSSFGPLDAASGAAALADAAAGARRRLVVVSCLEPAALEAERLRTPGARALRALLVAAAEATALDDRPEVPPADAPPAAPAVPAPGDDAATALAAHADGDPDAEDPLLAALVRHLRAAGAAVVPARASGDPDLTAVLADGRSVAVLPDARPVPAGDGAAAVRVAAADPLRRLAEADALRAAGWSVVHVAASELLVDPAAVAARVVGAARAPWAAA